VKTYLGRVIRDIARKAAGDPQLDAACANELMLARRVHAQNKNLRRVKGVPDGTDLRVFSLHAPEVECIDPFGRLRCEIAFNNDPTARVG
jgi:IS5 family transposase